MNQKQGRKPIGERLIASMEGGLAALRAGKPLPVAFVNTPPEPPVFGRARLVRLRSRYGFSQAALARFLHVSDKTVESWEQGTRRPNGAALRLLQVLETPAIFARMIPEASQPTAAARKQ